MSNTGVELNASRLEGSVERVTFYNPENGFSVLRLRPRGRREPVVVVGTLPAAQPGERLSLDGQWQTDSRHGAHHTPTVRRCRPRRGVPTAVGRYLLWLPQCDRHRAAPAIHRALLRRCYRRRPT